MKRHCVFILSTSAPHGAVSSRHDWLRVEGVSPLVVAVRKQDLQLVEVRDPLAADQQVGLEVTTQEPVAHPLVGVRPLLTAVVSQVVPVLRQQVWWGRRRRELLVRGWGRGGIRRRILLLAPPRGGVVGVRGRAQRRVLLLRMPWRVVVPCSGTRNIVGLLRILLRPYGGTGVVSILARNLALRAAG